LFQVDVSQKDTSSNIHSTPKIVQACASNNGLELYTYYASMKAVQQHSSTLQLSNPSLSPCKTAQTIIQNTLSREHFEGKDWLQ
jgi:hypothetical protein